MQDELVLWESFRQGDRSALADIFCTHYELLERYGRKVIPDSDILQDLIHDIFLHLWERKAPPPVTSIPSYLLGALRNRILVHYREQRKRSGGIPGELDFQVSAEDFIIEREEQRTQVRKLVAALGMIPPRQREILYLRYYCHLEYAEICELMDIGYQVARNQLSLALAALRKQV
jgi:RNA polymerase sigma factor (sigma-70 family)